MHASSIYKNIYISHGIGKINRDLGNQLINLAQQNGVANALILHWHFIGCSFFYNVENLDERLIQAKRLKENVMKIFQNH